MREAQNWREGMSAPRASKAQAALAQEELDPGVVRKKKKKKRKKRTQLGAKKHANDRTVKREEAHLWGMPAKGKPRNSTSTRLNG